MPVTGQAGPPRVNSSPRRCCLNATVPDESAGGMKPPAGNADALRAEDVGEGCQGRRMSEKKVSLSWYFSLLSVTLSVARQGVCVSCRGFHTPGTLARHSGSGRPAVYAAPPRERAAPPLTDCVGSCYHNKDNSIVKHDVLIKSGGGTGPTKPQQPLQPEALAPAEAGAKSGTQATPPGRAR